MHPESIAWCRVRHPHVLWWVAALLFGVVSVMNGAPLRVLDSNPRYFTDDGVRAVYLAGSHTWQSLQDISSGSDYLDSLDAWNHNFFRMWVWEQAAGGAWTNEVIQFSPLPYLRVGPEQALDGEPKYDLEAWNPVYFDRLRKRVEQAGDRGIYVAVMLFQGWCLDHPDFPGKPWFSHPFNPCNNIQGLRGLDGSIDAEGKTTLHSLALPEVTRLQERYVEKVLKELNHCDNVLWEIINEGGTIGWNRYMVDFIHRIEADLPNQHPVGITTVIDNDDAYASNAEWISPSNVPHQWMFQGMAPLQDYRNDPPVADGRKVLVPDTDHLWGHGGEACWVWKSFLRGLNPIFMDPWSPIPGMIAPPFNEWWGNRDGISRNSRDYPAWESIRTAMGLTRRYAVKMDLAHMIPLPSLASSRYCLANMGLEYLVYLPEGGDVTLDLRAAKGPLAVEWFYPQMNRTVSADPIAGGSFLSLYSHFKGESVLYLKSRNDGQDVDGETQPTQSESQTQDSL